MATAKSHSSGSHIPINELRAAILAELRIPAKANAIPEGSRTSFRDDPEHHRSVATLAS